MFAAGIRLVGLVVVLPVLVRHLTREQLGLWYVFQTLGGIAGLLDMGFSPAVTRSAGYLWGGAERLLPIGLAVRTANAEHAVPNLGLLTRLVATMRVYYFALALGTLLVLSLGGGAWVWHKTAGLANATDLRGAWLLYCVACMLSIGGSVWPALLMGINRVRESQQIQAMASSANYATTVAGLLLGGGLWAVVTGSLLGGILLRTAGRRVFLGHSGLDIRLLHTPDWGLLVTLWPMSWRSGLTGLGAYLILSFGTLICSATGGLAVTASYGLSMQCVSALSGLSAIWVMVKAPEIIRLRALGKLDTIASLFAIRVRIALLFYLAGTVALLVAGPALLSLIHAKSDLLERPALALMLLIMGLEMHHALFGMLVTSENHNPFVIPALASGLCVALGGWLLAPHFGYWGLLMAQGIVQASFNNWWIVLRGIRSLRIPASTYLKLLVAPRHPLPPPITPIRTI